ncbi:MAG: hypothetical protein IT423_06305 [Pirellulaceae bacterium]|nr:hypothetical protein [Pirellulaceae bacterium]
MRRLSLIALCLAQLFLYAGCGSGVKVVPVTGTVTLDGKPLPLKSVYFFPDRSSVSEGNGAGGYSDPQGKYYLIANLGGETTDTKGAPPGKYRVTVTEPAIPLTEESFKDMTATPAAEGDVPAAAIGLPSRPQKRTIPAVYSSADTTPLVVEVPKEGGEVNLELKSKP